MSATEEVVRKELISEQELRDRLYTAISTACDDYQKYSKSLSGANDRGVASGWASFARHGRSGIFKAISVDITAKVQSQNATWSHVADMLGDLDGYFADQKTSFSNHSLATYMLDELFKLINIQPTIPPRVYTAADWPALAMVIKAFVAPSDLIRPQPASAITILRYPQ